MPRLTQDRLLGYQFSVHHRTEPLVDKGQAVHDGQGNVRVIDVWDLVFVDPQTGHTLVFPFTREAKDGLVQALTGGIVVANGVPRI